MSLVDDVGKMQLVNELLFESNRKSCCRYGFLILNTMSVLIFQAIQNAIRNAFKSPGIHFFFNMINNNYYDYSTCILINVYSFIYSLQRLFKCLRRKRIERFAHGWHLLKRHLSSVGLPMNCLLYRDEKFLRYCLYFIYLTRFYFILFW